MPIAKCARCPFFTPCDSCERKDVCKTKPPVKSPGCCERQTGWFGKSGEGKVCHYIDYVHELEAHYEEKIENLERETSMQKHTLSKNYEKMAKIGKYLDKKETTCKHNCGRCEMWKREGVGAWGKCSVGNKENWVHATDNVCLLYNIIYDVKLVVEGKENILNNIGE
jgi:hypothetical protein